MKSKLVPFLISVAVAASFVPAAAGQDPRGALVWNFGTCLPDFTTLGEGPGTGGSIETFIDSNGPQVVLILPSGERIENYPSGHEGPLLIACRLNPGP